MMESPVRISLEMPAQGRDSRNRERDESSSDRACFKSFLLFTGFIINQLKCLNPLSDILLKIIGFYLNARNTKKRPNRIFS